MHYKNSDSYTASVTTPLLVLINWKYNSIVDRSTWNIYVQISLL